MSDVFEVVLLLLSHVARGAEVDQALVDAVADTSDSRVPALIVELARHGGNVNYEDGRAIHLAVTQANLAILPLLCDSNPSKVTSAALPLAFHAHGKRLPKTLPIIEFLLTHGMGETTAILGLQKAVEGSPGNLDIVQRFVAADTKLVDSNISLPSAMCSRKRPF